MIDWAKNDCQVVDTARNGQQALEKLRTLHPDIVICDIAMPGMTAQLQPDSCTGFETAASMYGGSDALGYIIVGLLAFLLGVCMTILCFRLRQMERDEKDEGQHGAD